MNKPGTSIQYSEKNDYWGYPDSACFIKQFAIDTVHVGVDIFKQFPFGVDDLSNRFGSFLR